MTTVSSVASYHLPDTVQKYIRSNAKQMQLAHGKFLAFLIDDYQRIKNKNQRLEAYFEMAMDHNTTKEQIKEEEEDFSVESKYNPAF